MGAMGTLHMSETEVARDFPAVLAKVRQGIEVVVERDQQPVAVIQPPKAAGRMISEILADLEARASTAAMDEDFARDIEEGIKAQREPWNQPGWAA